jgi:hypothetical protein
MAKKYKYSAAEAQLQPVAIMVVLTTLSVACLLLGTAAFGSSPGTAEAYQVTAER